MGLGDVSDSVLPKPVIVSPARMPGAIVSTVCRSTGAGNASGPAGTVQPGRDHWPRAFTNVWAGGGIQTGGVIGATDKRGEDVIERPCSAHDFLATIYHHLGIDSAKETINDFSGRPTPIVPNGSPIRELIRV